MIHSDHKTMAIYSKILFTFLSVCSLVSCNNRSGRISIKDSESTASDISNVKRISAKRGCGFIPLDGYFFPSDQTDPDSSVTKIVTDILEETGMHLNNNNKNFILTKSKLITSAVALSDVVINPYHFLFIYRYIIYDKAFLDSVNKRCSAGGKYVLFAHEISHHLNGDNFSEDLSDDQRRQMELAADNFAGYLCYRLSNKNHLTLDSSITIFKLYADSIETNTHPAKDLRIKNFADGWNYSKKLSGYDCEMQNALERNPSLVITTLYNTDPVYLSDKKTSLAQDLSSISDATANNIRSLAIRKGADTSLINLRGAAAAAFLTKSGNNLFDVQSDQLVPLTYLQKEMSFTPKVEQGEHYIIDEKNIIWAKYPNGIPYIAGYIRKISKK